MNFSLSLSFSIGSRVVTLQSIGDKSEIRARASMHISIVRYADLSYVAEQPVDVTRAVKIAIGHNRIQDRFNGNDKNAWRCATIRTCDVRGFRAWHICLLL